MNENVDMLVQSLSRHELLTLIGELHAEVDDKVQALEQATRFCSLKRCPKCEKWKVVGYVCQECDYDD